MVMTEVILTPGSHGPVVQRPARGLGPPPPQQHWSSHLARRSDIAQSHVAIVVAREAILRIALLLVRAALLLTLTEYKPLWLPSTLVKTSGLFVARAGEFHSAAIDNSAAGNSGNLQPG
jgi:hypothetical protein